MAEGKNMTYMEKLPSICAGAFLKATCFDGLMNFGASSEYQGAKFLLAASIYFIRDSIRELLPEDYKFLAIGSGFLAGGIKGYVGKGEFYTTALNNAAYETSKYFFNGTVFDDWVSGSIIEGAEAAYTVGKVSEAAKKAAYFAGMEMLAATKIYDSASPYVDNCVKYFISSEKAYICFPQENEGYDCKETSGSIIPYDLNDSFLLCKGSTCTPLVGNVNDHSEL